MNQHYIFYKFRYFSEGVTQKQRFIYITKGEFVMNLLVVPVENQTIKENGGSKTWKIKSKELNNEEIEKIWLEIERRSDFEGGGRIEVKKVKTKCTEKELIAFLENEIKNHRAIAFEFITEAAEAS